MSIYEHNHFESMCMSVSVSIQKYMHAEIPTFGAMAKLITRPLQYRSKADVDSGASEKNTHHVTVL